MTSAIATQPQLGTAIEACLMEGDLSKLDNAGRMHFYSAICNSLGLNPLTSPFEYIKLNGKLRLYAKKDCTDQLRNLQKVSITAFKAEQIGDLFVCTANGQKPDGRIDTSTGAVCIEGLRGEALANAMMKAETKAKRRLTLSLCGLGLLDESEVEEQSFDTPYQPAQAPQAISSPKLTLTQQLEGAVAAPPCRVNGQNVTALLVDVLGKKTKVDREYLVITIDGDIQGQSALFCYHGSLREALLTAKGQVCQFEWAKPKDWIVIENVLAIGAQEYRDGVPYNPDSEPITDSDVPF